jgi:outer membrane protein TolC
MPLNDSVGWRRWLSNAVTVLAALVLISGCAVGPNFRPPAAPVLTAYTRPSFSAKTTSADILGGEEQRFLLDQDLPGEWWTLLGSPPLNALMAKAIEANPTLVAAESALRQARELYFAGQGHFYPTVQASFSASRQKATAALSPPLSGPELSFDLYSTLGTLSYALDIFGGIRRQVESLGATLEGQRFQLEAVYLTLT